MGSLWEDAAREPPLTSADAFPRGRREAQEWMLAEIMSEVTDAPVIIQPAKSEDKLEIEKEEAGETTEKAEEELGEKAAESDEKAAESDEKVAEAEDGGKTEEKPASEDVESSDVTEKEKKEKRVVRKLKVQVRSKKTLMMWEK